LKSLLRLSDLPAQICFFKGTFRHGLTTINLFWVANPGGFVFRNNAGSL
jgi:hypothetical protein